MQEPLTRVWLYEVKVQLNSALQATTNNQKKIGLEKLAEIILERVAGLSIHAKDKRQTTSEVDLIMQNRSVLLGTAGLGGPIFVECRNVTKPVDAKSVRDFAGKLPPDGVGIIVTTDDLTKDARLEMKNQISQNINRRIRLLFWNKDDLNSIANGEITPEDLLIERYYTVLSL